MTIQQRAAQFWAVLAFAVRTQQIVTYSLMERLTGIPSYAQADTLGVIAQYCKRQDFPLLTVLVVSEQTGLPMAGIMEPLAALQEQARVFAFDWLGQKFPDFES
ncbi:MAG TPA: hypothetical protein VOA78_09260 [Candidatus Dormibacteraeota bacterium]|nr:hypothetical protein [Candidatus Dormibacteraeota bacterium]